MMILEQVNSQSTRLILYLNSSINCIKVGDGDMKVTLRSAKIIERMVNQNTYDEINQGNFKKLTK
jgi:hypothetical protein